MQLLSLSLRNIHRLNAQTPSTIKTRSSKMFSKDFPVSDGLPATYSRRRTRSPPPSQRPGWPSSRGAVSPRKTSGGASTSEQNTHLIRSRNLWKIISIQMSERRRLVAAEPGVRRRRRHDARPPQEVPRARQHVQGNRRGNHHRRPQVKSFMFS